MKKKEYIEKLENLIVNRVKFHAPKVNESSVDFSLLRAINVDEKYPIFIFEKPLNKVLFHAFLKAKNRCKFNLILMGAPDISSKKIMRLEKTYLLDKNLLGSGLLDVLYSLNINYTSTPVFERTRKDEYLKINNQNVKLDFVPFYNHKKWMFNGIIGQVRQFLLNGKNYSLEFVNTRNCVNEVEFEINLPLPQGYYSFKRSFDHIEINNLTSKDRAFFNYFVKDAKVEFSCVEGIENCTFACVNMKGKIALKPKQKKYVFFNFGNERFNLISARDIQTFFDDSQSEMFKIFDARIISKNARFDEMFNLQLPKSIWDAWGRFSCNRTAEEKWLAIRSSIIKSSEKGIEICEEQLPLKEIQLYKNNLWKRIFIMYGESKYLFAGKVKYYNFTTLTKEIFDKNNEIYLSFAS
ncbi:MAG: hypothetical protein IJY90_01070 [Clostridia bacterium]|nr:hypothetical protein [Clostridia bacterium]